MTPVDDSIQPPKRNDESKRRVLFDMEASDPDDVLTVCLLATHPELELAAVTVMPVTPTQIGIVRSILGFLEQPAPIGAWDRRSCLGEDYAIRNPILPEGRRLDDQAGSGAFVIAALPI